MKKKILIAISLLVATMAIVFAVVAIIYNFLSQEKLTVLELLANGIVWLFTICIVIAAALVLIFNDRMSGNKRILKVNKIDESHWLTFKEMSKNSNIKITTLSSLDKENDGIPIYAEARSKTKDIDVVLGKPIHTLIVGTTGSGKTSGFVDPTIQILSRCKTRPGMVITDPKGELYVRHSQSLRDAGYNVQLIDLIDVYHSSRWNPFFGILTKTEAINRLRDENIEFEKGKYYFFGTEYLSYEQADIELKTQINILEDEIYSDTQDLIYTICPVTNSNDSGWQEGARDLIFALAVAFWEDVRDGLMPPYKLNLYNLYKNISVYLTPEMTEFKEYFARRDKFSRTKGLSNTVLISQDKTLTSYLTDVNRYLNWMADRGLASLTSGNDVELNTFDEQPNVLFLRIPDHIENRYKIAKLLVTQMYKTFVDKADRNLRIGKTKEQELLRNVYFIMDEFLNMPKFDNIVNMMRVGRSRKIFMLPIIQDFAGMDALYTKDISTSIQSACNIKIFIGTTDINTAKEFSEACGKHRIKSISFSESKDISVSTSAQDQPLINFDALMRLNDPPDRMGNAVVLAFGKYPLQAKYSPLFKARETYNIVASEIEKRSAEIFQEELYFYDIAKRNSFLAENERLLQMQDDDFEKTLNELRNQRAESSATTDPCTELKQLVTKKIRELKGKIQEESLQMLLNCELEKLPVMLEKLIDAAQESHNNFLVFQLVSLNVLAKDVLKMIAKIEINSLDGGTNECGRI